jgi:hypothetical protein
MATIEVLFANYMWLASCRERLFHPRLLLLGFLCGAAEILKVVDVQAR